MKKLCFILSFVLCVHVGAFAQDVNSVSWEEQFQEYLPYLGHRNWILVVDAAYPLQSSAGIKTIISGEEITDVAETVLKHIENVNHITPIVYQDKEFSYMKNQWSPKCETLRDEMATILAPYNPNVIMHDDIFTRLDTASELFNVVVIKTNCITPYSSVFIELDCGYWNSSAESALRDEMNR